MDGSHNLASVFFPTQMSYHSAFNSSTVTFKFE